MEANGQSGRLADPHAASPVRTAGPAARDAAATVVLLHGRGATAESILELHTALGMPRLRGVAPQAASNAWYPQSFLAPFEANQPFLNSALARVESLVVELLTAGVASRRIALLGFRKVHVWPANSLPGIPADTGLSSRSRAGSSGPKARCVRTPGHFTARQYSSAQVIPTRT